MARIFPPTCRFIKRLTLGDGLSGYLFQDGEQLAAVVWAVDGFRARTIRLRSEKLRLLDIMGRKQAAPELKASGTPVYIVSEGMSVPAFEAALQ